MFTFFPCFFFFFFFDGGLALLPKLVTNLWAQMILPFQPHELLGLQACPTTTGYV
jgi:hypothetical protein